MVVGSVVQLVLIFSQASPNPCTTRAIPSSDWLRRELLDSIMVHVLMFVQHLLYVHNKWYCAARRMSITYGFYYKLAALWLLGSWLLIYF